MQNRPVRRMEFSLNRRFFPLEMQDCSLKPTVTPKLQSWTNFFGTLVFISVQCTFFGLQMPPPSPPFNVGHKLVHFQPCTPFSVYFPQATLNGGGVGGAKEPRNVITSDLKDKMLYCPNEFVHDCSFETNCAHCLLTVLTPAK